MAPNRSHPSAIARRGPTKARSTLIPRTSHMHRLKTRRIRLRSLPNPSSRSTNQLKILIDLNCRLIGTRFLLKKSRRKYQCMRTWNKTSLANEIQVVAQNCRPAKMTQGRDNNGPSPASLGRFLKKSGGMGGADNEAYYFGNILLEKLTIWNGEKKTKAREKAEQEFPLGRKRIDPAHFRIICRADERPSYGEVANMGRKLNYPNEYEEP
ncbi:hypothetical protein BDV96DRAFT_688787 [Lophiotrema nucula]|uniref:Uncharacterized protein n=1 Tax=Lophiotrema nucula TaxID=690887 RepID=A0A6A5Z401_9PLEO|nr:hypothetical protein BDV96DRAFT_688787 [Lophiotrema nucula]